MKKKILALTAALMLFAGVVSASSINGDYKGNPIVKVTSNGKQLETDEVPAMIYDGHTVVPISLLRQLGASVSWDQDTYSVDVKLPTEKQNAASVDNSISIKKLVIILDAYKRLQDITNTINDYADFLSLFFTGENNNYQNKYTEKEMMTRFESIKARNDKFIKDIDGISSLVKPHDVSKFKTITSMNQRALDTFDQASVSLLKWKDNKSNLQLGQKHFDDYLFKVNQATAITREAHQIAYEEYEATITTIFPK
ncbi:stalk domain-containing protein [Neobacillus pocheonensis]|uniref:stalk domain-containing protein n=1 Tax=Neobacillus pocheonensis TaxID=363869 RepID=UPI003D2D6D63